MSEAAQQADEAAGRLRLPQLIVRPLGFRFHVLDHRNFMDDSRARHQTIKPIVSANHLAVVMPSLNFMKQIVGLRKLAPASGG